MALVLIVDDEPNMRWVLQEALGKAGYTALAAANGEEALTQLSMQPVDLVILDLKLRGADGLSVLRQIHERYPQLLVLMLTAYGTVATAVEALQLGAADFLRKPFDVEEILFKIARALERRAMQQELARLRGPAPAPIPGADPGWRRSIELGRQTLAQHLHLRVEGEVGTGKAWITRAAHSGSQRGAAPLVELDCATMPESYQRELLIGQPQGFWYSAGSGVLLLRHVAALGEAAVAGLLELARNQQGQRAGPLLITTGGAEDWALFDRLGGEGRFLRIRVPALREHRDDLPLFAAEWIGGRELSQAAQIRLHSYGWPGNLAELRGVLERAAALAGSGIIGEQHLPRHIAALPQDALLRLPEYGLDLEQLEIALIRQALVRSRGNKSRAAELLGLSRHTLLYRIEKYQIGEEASS